MTPKVTGMCGWGFLRIPCSIDNTLLLYTLFHEIFRILYPVPWNFWVYIESTCPFMSTHVQATYFVPCSMTIEVKLLRYICFVPTSMGNCSIYNPLPWKVMTINPRWNWCRFAGRSPAWAVTFLGVAAYPTTLFWRRRTPKFNTSLQSAQGRLGVLAYETPRSSYIISL